MTRHNLCTNPALKNNNTGWGGGSTPARSTGLTGFPDRTTGASYTSGTFMTGPVAAVTAGQTITFSIYARSNNFNVNSGTIYIQWNDASTVSTGYTLTAGVVTRVSITATVPAGKTSAQIVMDGQNYASSSGDYTELLYEVAGSAGTYFDGDTASASWDGADGNSASTLSSVISGDATSTITASSTAAGANAAVAAATSTETVGGTVVGANAAAGAATSTITSGQAATGRNAAVGAASQAVTAGSTATGANAAVAAAAAAITAGSTAAAVVGSIASQAITVGGVATATVTSAARGSWYQLLDIVKASRAEAKAIRDAPPVACPVDGEPLQPGPHGGLHCPWDGWQYPRDYIRGLG